MWQRGGYSNVPAPGERFVLNIHKQHGVTAPRRKEESFFVALHADGDTREEAEANLAEVLEQFK